MFEIRGESTPTHKLSSLNLDSRLLTAKLTINHVEVSAVVDTGATVSFIPNMGIIMLTAQPKLEKASVKVQAADNTIIKITQKTKLAIRPSEVDMNYIVIKVLVVEDKTDVLGHDTILGNTDIVLLGFRIDNVDGHLVVMRGEREVGRESKVLDYSNAAIIISEGLDFAAKISPEDRKVVDNIIEKNN